MCEPSGDLGSLRQIALADVQVPQREFGFGVCEEVGIHRCGLMHVDERLLSVAATEQPPRAPGHLGVDDVIDPGAGDARSHVSWIVFEYRIERSSRFPVLVPTGLSTDETELKPHIVQIHLAEKEQRGVIVGIGSERGVGQVLPAMDFSKERRNQARTRDAVLQRLPPVAVILDQRPKLEEQRGGAQFVRARAVRASARRLLRSARCRRDAAHRRAPGDRAEPPPAGWQRGGRKDPVAHERVRPSSSCSRHGPPTTYCIVAIVGSRLKFLRQPFALESSSLLWDEISARSPAFGNVPERDDGADNGAVPINR